VVAQAASASCLLKFSVATVLPPTSCVVGETPPALPPGVVGGMPLAPAPCAAMAFSTMVDMPPLGTSDSCKPSPCSQVALPAQNSEPVGSGTLVDATDVDLAKLGRGTLMWRVGLGGTGWRGESLSEGRGTLTWRVGLGGTGWRGGSLREMPRVFGGAVCMGQGLKLAVPSEVLGGEDAGWVPVLPEARGSEAAGWVRAVLAAEGGKDADCVLAPFVSSEARFAARSVAIAFRSRWYVAQYSLSSAGDPAGEEDQWPMSASCAARCFGFKSSSRTLARPGSSQPSALSSALR
jgi:hypothetical protein